VFGFGCLGGLKFGVDVVCRGEVEKWELKEGRR
jgi:hypothetical protein